MLLPSCVIVLSWRWVSWRQVTYPLPQKGVSLSVTTFVLELAYTMDIDDDNND